MPGALLAWGLEWDRTIYCSQKKVQQMSTVLTYRKHLAAIKQPVGMYT